MNQKSYAYDVTKHKNVARGLSKLSTEDLTPVLIRLNEKFDYIEEYNINELCLCEKNGKWGVLNKKGELIVPCEYQYPSDKHWCLNQGFKDEDCVLLNFYKDRYHSEGKDLYISYNEKINCISNLSSFAYTTLYYDIKSIIVAHKNEKLSIVDFYGYDLLKQPFDNLVVLSESSIAIIADNKIGIVTIYENIPRLVTKVEFCAKRTMPTHKTTVPSAHLVA